MPIFARTKKSTKGSDEKQREPKASTAPPTSISASTTARPNPSRASHTYAPQRPSNLRTSSSSSVRSLPAMPLMTRSAASEPNLSSRGRKDLSIDSVMMSRSQDPSPNGRMMLHTRQPDFKPTMYTYDPSKAPSLSGRKRQYRSHNSKPPTRASSFVMSPHIVTMVEEQEEVEEQAGSSSSSTKSHESESSTQSQYLEMARTTSNRMQQQQDEVLGEVGTPAPEIPARNPARNSISSRRTSVASNTEPKTDSAIATHPSISSEPKAPGTLATADRPESPGPKSKRRTWFSSKKRQSAPVEAH